MKLFSVFPVLLVLGFLLWMPIESESGILHETEPKIVPVRSIVKLSYYDPRSCVTSPDGNINCLNPDEWYKMSSGADLRTFCKGDCYGAAMACPIPMLNLVREIGEEGLKVQIEGFEHPRWCMDTGQAIVFYEPTWDFFEEKYMPTFKVDIMYDVQKWGYPWERKPQRNAVVYLPEDLVLDFMVMSGVLGREAPDIRMK